MKKVSNSLVKLLKVKFVILLLASLLSSSACYMNTPVPVTEDNTNSQARLPRTNKPMPPLSANVGWTLLDNKRKKLSEYEGKVVILDFWATYCQPCLEGTPHLVNLQNQYGKDGLVVIGLNVGGDEDRPKIAAFISQFNVQYDIAVPDDEFVNMFMEGSGIPQTIILDRRGRVAGHFLGFSKEIGEKIDEAVKKALTE